MHGKSFMLPQKLFFFITLDSILRGRGGADIVYTVRTRGYTDLAVYHSGIMTASYHSNMFQNWPN